MCVCVVHTSVKSTCICVILFVHFFGWQLLVCVCACMCVHLCMHMCVRVRVCVHVCVSRVLVIKPMWMSNCEQGDDV
jgi:hypothetical protein